MIRNSTHFDGTEVPVEEPSTASEAAHFLVRYGPIPDVLPVPSPIDFKGPPNCPCKWEGGFLAVPGEPFCIQGALVQGLLPARTSACRFLSSTTHSNITLQMRGSGRGLSLWLRS